MAEALWDFFSCQAVGPVRDAAITAVLGTTPSTILHCWRGPTPGADLLFADQSDVLQACVELKRAGSPSQYPPLHRALKAQPYPDSTGAVDGLSAAISNAAAARTPHRHAVAGDACGDADHTQKRRDGSGAHVWSCALPQIDLYRGFVLLPADATAAMSPQDPANVRWVFIAEDDRPLEERYPGALSAGAWSVRTWDRLVSDLRSAAAAHKAASLTDLAARLDTLR